MKKALLVLALIGISHYSYTNAGGAPAGRSGSPASNGQTCSGGYCHSGGTATGNEIINIEVENVTSGLTDPNPVFVSGDQMNITVTAVTGGSWPKVGFSASVEDGSGNFVSSTTADTNTKIVGGGNFASHKSSSNTPSNDTISWTFTIEDDGTATPDSLVVYAAVNFCNGNGNYQGDYTMTATQTINRVYIGQEEPEVLPLIVGPNPATEFVEASHPELVSIELFNTIGRFINLEERGVATEGKVRIDVSHMARGNYILHATYLDGRKTYKHIILQ